MTTSFSYERFQIPSIGEINFKSASEIPKQRWQLDFFDSTNSATPQREVAFG
jgi:hypothetical protein